MALLNASRRRLYFFVAVAFVLVLVLAWNSRSEHARLATQYLKDKSKDIYQGLTKPDWSYVTGSKDPETYYEEDELESEGSHATPKPKWKHPSSGKFDLQEEDESEKLADFYENPDLTEIEIGPVSETHYTIESISGEDGKFFAMDFLGRTGLNPNVIPHPAFEDKWIMVALQDPLWGDDVHSAFKVEMVCLGSFEDGKLVCDDHPTTLPIKSSTSSNCDVPDAPAIVGLVSLSIGPHDARVFYGPENPYIMYGALSDHHNVCLGQWLQDFRTLVEWGPFVGPWNDFGIAKDVQRPPPTRIVEKNYFVFWGSDGRMYVHYDLEPRRVFAQIDLQGRVGRNLAQLSRKSDQKCWDRWLESTPFANGTHQATNSLSVTLCKSSDPGCKETDDNTYIMHVFQKKLLYGGHAYYLPYVLLFHRTPPFAMFGITAKPFWMKGQREAGQELTEGEEDIMGHGVPVEHHEQIYITSMNWKEKGKNYHGFLDDVLFLTFGREDTWVHAMDLTPESLIGELLTC